MKKHSFIADGMNDVLVRRAHPSGHAMKINQQPFLLVFDRSMKVDAAAAAAAFVQRDIN